MGRGPDLSENLERATKQAKRQLRRARPKPPPTASTNPLKLVKDEFKAKTYDR